MSRIPSPTDFSVEVEGVGTFVFGRRKLADEVKIHVEYARMTEAVTPTPWLDNVATWVSTLRVMTVVAPPGFVIDEMDPFDEGTYERLARVYKALIDKEGSFRRGPAEAGKAGGQAAGEDVGVLVSPQVQPGAERPAVS